MTTPDTSTPRERYRAQVQEEIKQHAWEQIASAGASALSLNAIAKQMGMSGPALYRYFANRDDLITALIRDAYRSLADTFRTAAHADGDLPALAHALRTWALADPHRYLLLYGTPVPGYHAPADTIEITSEIMSTLLTTATPHQALTFWTRLHGVLSLELAGHFTGMDFSPAAFYEAEVAALSTP
ncbi:TetR family transcriptional regulator [Streptomyces tateyamensis]|uniref:TetR family transcriptional regulator n=1 Tax=Streptomyces tateyamensis TaxID=565073 RepID=A0A2V4MUJ3_9ACTN|nr:TetR/AcrR family transcriptional regulator [Streptomyces tateyamensis]PYC69045.1 TetR family transcriptional regulator [Streptomyces tateyamensis]